jgi:hypothetical protein
MNFLRKRKKRKYTTIYKCLIIRKNNRERQKSYFSYKHKLQISKKLIEKEYDYSFVHKPIIIIRICGFRSRIPKEIQLILPKINLKEIYNANDSFFNKENFKMLKLIKSYRTWVI